jgi:hypothetical protein
MKLAACHPYSPSSSSATTSLFESFCLLSYFLPFNQILDEFCPILFITLKSSFISFSHIMFHRLANLVDIGVHSYNFLTTLTFVIRRMWPNQLNLRILM